MRKNHQTTIFFYRCIRKKGVQHDFWIIWTTPENFFFWPSRGELVKIFIFCEKPLKNQCFCNFWYFRITKSFIFHWFFNKNEMWHFFKNHFLHKNKSKITISAFFVTVTKIQKSWFFNGFSSKMSRDIPKNHWKKSWFLARTHFCNFEFT